MPGLKAGHDGKVKPGLTRQFYELRINNKKIKIHIFRHHYRSFPGNFVIYSGFIKQLLMNTMNLQTKKEDQVFVNLLTDAGVKAVYADPANKQLLINLLNTVLPDDVRVSDIVEYRDREQNPDTIFSKKTVLDLVCKDAEGNILGIEVQKKVDSRLFSRCVFYAAGQYHSQLLAGGDYASLHPVFEIAFSGGELSTRESWILGCRPYCLALHVRRKTYGRDTKSHNFYYLGGNWTLRQN